MTDPNTNPYEQSYDGQQPVQPTQPTQAAQPAQPTQEAQPQYAQPTYGQPTYEQPAYGSAQQAQQPQYAQPQYTAAQDAQSAQYASAQYADAQQAQYANAQQAQYAYGQQQYTNAQYAQQPGQQQYAAQGSPVYTYPAATAANVEPPLNMPWYGISFGQAIARFFKKYATFSGRASRSEFWWAFLFVELISVVLSGFSDNNSFFTGLETLWNLATICPMLALGWRRMHDSNMSGAWTILPYGLIIVGYILFAAAAVSGIVAITGYGSGAGSMVAFAGFGVCFVLAGLIVAIVFYCRKSNPLGARFDQQA